MYLVRFVPRAAPPSTPVRAELHDRIGMDQEGYTALHAALERDADRGDLLELLLTAGAPVNAKGINDWTPAHMAAARDDVEALRVLVAHGADLTIRTGIDDRATPLEEGRILGSRNAVRFLEDLESRRET